MDIGAIGHSGHYLRVAAFSPEVFLHQAEVDIDESAYFRDRRTEIVRFYRDRGYYTHSRASKERHNSQHHIMHSIQERLNSEIFPSIRRTVNMKGPPVQCIYCTPFAIASLRNRKLYYSS